MNETWKGDLLICSACGEYKPVDSFSMGNKNKLPSRRGRYSYCRQCTNEKVRKHRKANPAANRVIQRRANIKRLYGITADEYDSLLASQEGRCGICGTHESETRIHLDHCHATGKIRAFLCYGCNTALGMMKDSPELLRKAADYLEEHKVSTP